MMAWSESLFFDGSVEKRSIVYKSTRNKAAQPSPLLEVTNFASSSQYTHFGLDAAPDHGF
jgi:hypothetical protein